MSPGDVLLYQQRVDIDEPEADRIIPGIRMLGRGLIAEDVLG